MAMRTYGDKPLCFQLEENGEYFYVGSEVRIVFIFGCILRQHKGAAGIQKSTDDCVICDFRWAITCASSEAHSTKSIRAWCAAI